MTNPTCKRSTTSRRRRLALVATAGAVVLGSLTGPTTPAGAEPATQPLDPPSDLVASGVDSSSAYGSDVAVSADGTVAVVGAPLDGGAGSVTLFTRAGDEWIEQAEVTAPEPTAGAEFGSSVSLDSNGDTLVVGAPGTDGGNGAVYVFSGPDWADPPVTVLPAPGGGAFGTDVELDHDGTSVVVGSPGDEEEQGSVWLFRGPDWLEAPVQQLERETGGAGDLLGDSVAMAGDGSHIAAGAPGDGTAAVWFGPEFIEWIDVTSPAPADGDRFGYALDLSDDGGRLLVGAPSAPPGGAAWRYLGSDGYAAETAQQLLIESADGAEVGASLAVSGNGRAALVGAPGMPGVWLLKGSDDPANADPILLPPGPPGPHGFGVALPHRGDVCLVGTSGPVSAAGAKRVTPGLGGASYCNVGRDIRGTVLAEVDPDPANGFQLTRDVLVRLYYVRNGVRVPIGVPQTPDFRGEFGFIAPFPGDYVVEATRKQYMHSIEPSDEELVEDVVPGGETEMVTLELEKQLLPEGGSIMEKAWLRGGEWTSLGDPESIVAFQSCVGGTNAKVFAFRRAGGAVGDLIFEGDLNESTDYPGRYTGAVASPPVFTEVRLSFRVTCPEGDRTGELNGYLDPSGKVLDTFDRPVPEATVVLRRADSEDGPFATVPDGSTIMSPENRTNPDATTDAGAYRWDVLPGFYVVRASKAGCHAPGNPAQEWVESPILEVPPPRVDIDLVLDCGGEPDPVTAREPVFACPDSVPEDGYTDVTDENVHEPRVDCVTWWGVAQGTGPGLFSPERTTTRGQMATFLVRVAEAIGQPFAPGPDAFSDDDGNTHEDAINALANIGIILGRADGTVGPDDPVSRDQMASFIVRTVEALLGGEIEGARDAFTDDDGNTHEPSIDKAAHLGITGGRAPGVYAPADPTRRDQMTSFLARTLDVLVANGHGGLPAS